MSSTTSDGMFSWLPGVQKPLIVSAPMLGASNGTLAAEVSKAGGLGIVPLGMDFTPGGAGLKTMASELATARRVLGPSAPLGAGFLTFHGSVGRFAESAIPMLREHNVTVAWLFAPDRDAENAGAAPHAEIIAALHGAGIKAMVQVGSVAAAREAAREGADVIVAQGTDAGGHQFACGAGVVSLVPEVRDMLDEEFAGRGIGLVAAGGIADERGVAAALVLGKRAANQRALRSAVACADVKWIGADAAVMGTRFLASEESTAGGHYRKAILEGKDGGQLTVKSTFHDDIRQTVVWPQLYDGRAIINKSYEEHVSGVTFEENRKKYQEAVSSGDGTRLVTWSGTALGLVKEVLPAGEIVRKVREGARQRIQKVQSGL
ncbi:uncharacterized protein E0L32_012090 [Thyridium curvatum]|uniref:Uncharacterized protein n=1 Tax=Thyridium curvatum TaxID=1093900 RepID=A0A507BLN9_9PEZI|nr:uncharacterized protein E0L32_012090 [Thyridium curvatum]TPX17610.1 hypothetical protein E0L32_012090 [Thyridium curvatum]